MVIKKNYSQRLAFVNVKSQKLHIFMDEGSIMYEKISHTCPLAFRVNLWCPKSYFHRDVFFILLLLEVLCTLSWPMRPYPKVICYGISFVCNNGNLGLNFLFQIVYMASSFTWSTMCSYLRLLLAYCSLYENPGKLKKR